MQKKTIAIASVACASILLSGCQQEELSTTSATQQEEKAQSAVEKLVKTPDRVQEKVDDAVAQQNAKNEEVKEMLGEEGNDNSMNKKTMDNIPSEIDMAFAETCKGATVKTNRGVFEIKLYGDKAPVTVANFCTLADKGFYDSVIFHRVIEGFMVQGGDPTGTGTGGPGYKFDDELPEAGEYKIGSLAMANSGPNTNGSQFFVVTGESGVGLPPLYTLFGEVVSGMESVTAIEQTETGAMDKPVEDVVIESVTLIQ